MAPQGDPSLRRCVIAVSVLQLFARHGDAGSLDEPQPVTKERGGDGTAAVWIGDAFASDAVTKTFPAGAGVGVGVAATDAVGADTNFAALAVEVSSRFVPLSPVA